MVAVARYRWWLATMAGLALFLTIAGRVGALTPLQSALLWLVEPVGEGLHAIFAPAAAVLSDIGKLRRLQEENRQLRLENESLKAQVAELRQDTTRLQELESALGVIQSGGGQRLLAANVLAHDVSVLTHTVLIDRGSADGVREGMVVLSPGGSLVGKVIRALPQQAFVRLIDDSRSVVAVRIQETGIDGSLHASADRKLEVKLARGEVAAGATVVTSGLGGEYPPGLPVGRVVEVSGTPQDMFRTVRVEPFAQLAAAQTLLVLTSFTPQALAGN